MRLNTLREKVKKRTNRFLSKYIPLHKEYIPTVIRTLQDGPTNGISIMELGAPYLSTVTLKTQFISDCSSFVKPTISVQYPANFFVTLKNGRIYLFDSSNVAVISSDNELIDELCFQFKHGKMLAADENMILKLSGLNKPRRYKGKVFSMIEAGAAKYYYYHWVYDVLPKLCLLKQSGRIDEIDFFLVPNYEFRFQKEYLDYFGISKDKIINGDIENHIEAENLMLCSEIRREDHHPKWACDFLHDSFFKLNLSPKQEKRIYIARGDAVKNRKLLNEQELIMELKKLKFEIHYLTKLSVIEQVKLFNLATFIIGAHGGGLSNLVYCEPGTKVLELFPDNYVRHLFYDISNKRELNYDYLLCESDGPAIDHTDGQKIGLTVNVKELKIKIDSLLFLPLEPNNDMPIAIPIESSIQNGNLKAG